MYSMIVVAIGCMFLSIACGMIGTISILKGQSLIGDAIGHSVFPGVILMFMITKEKNPILLSIGAFIFGTISFLFIQLIDSYSKIKLDAILGIALSTFFGLGMMLKGYIQSNENFRSSKSSGINDYIFGQAAYLKESDIYIVAGISILAIVVLIFFYKEIKLFIFDENYSISIGYKKNLLNFIILFMTLILISIGLRVVGSLLISSLLIIPGVTACMWSKKFNIVLIISGIVAGISAILGTYISSLDSLSTGPCIILILAFFTIISIFISPNGILNRKRG